MKYFCELPEAKHYAALPCDRPDRWRWKDKDSDLIIIDSRIPNPWRETACVQVGWKKNSGNDRGFRMVTGAKLLIFDPRENPNAAPGRLIRDIYRSRIAFSEYSPDLVEYFSMALSDHRHLSYEFFLLNS